MCNVGISAENFADEPIECSWIYRTNGFNEGLDMNQGVERCSDDPLEIDDVIGLGSFEYIFGCASDACKAINAYTESALPKVATNRSRIMGIKW